MTSASVQSPSAARAAAGLPGARIDVPMGDRRQATFFLDALFGRRPEGSFAELRLLPSREQMFYSNPRNLAVVAGQRAETQDVYVGVVPRAVKKGGRDSLVPESYWMWAECDNEAAVERALDFHTPPPLVVRSSPGKAHCYWPLLTPLPLDMLERANKRMAWHLGADPRATDAARILRLPGTLNHKYPDKPRVSITLIDTTMRNVLPSQLVAALPDPTPPRPLPVRPKTYAPDPDLASLLDEPARVYVERLSGRGVVRDMAQCPWHKGGQERSPSLHVGGPAGTLWYCHGCCEGGDQIAFAAKLWGMDTKRDFVEIKRRLLGGGA